MQSRSMGRVALVVVASLLAAGCVSITPPGEITPAARDAATGFSGTDVFPGEYVTEGRFSRVLEPGVFGLLPQERHTFASDYDGVTIEVGVVRPDVPEGEKVPVIAFASPYLKSLSEIDYTERLARLVENFVPHGYAVALVPVRGTADMGGCMDLMGPAERADLDQAITWLGEQPWSNGHVGMIGGSYDGSTPWEVAAMGNPYLKTMVPVSGVNDIYHLMFRNGTVEFRGPVLLNALYYQYGFLENNPTNGRSAEHTVAGVVCPEAYEGFYASIHSALTGERDPLGFWEERNSRPGVEENYQGSVLHVQGLQDWNVDPGHNIPWVLELEQQGITVKHLYGQWGHAWPDSAPEESPHARWDWAEILKRWFDRELKGLDVDVGPAVQVEDSSGKWRSEDQWPPADAEPVTFHLTADGKLAPEGGAEGTALVDASCGDGGLWDAVDPCAYFETDPFGQEFRFAGMPALRLTATPAGPGGHVTAILNVVDGGSVERIGWGQVDLRYAEGGETMSTVTPGQPMQVYVEIEPLDAVVPAGAKLQLEIFQGGYGDHLPGAPLPVEIHTGGDASTLTVLSFERGEDAFFTPPGK